MFGSQFLNKFDQITKRAKWSKLGFWLRRLVFRLSTQIYDLMVWDMISRIQIHHFDLMAWFKTFLRINWLIIENWSTIEKVNCTLKSQTLTFWSKSNLKKSYFIKTCENIQVVHQEIKKSKLSLKIQNSKT